MVELCLIFGSGFFAGTDSVSKDTFQFFGFLEALLVGPFVA